MSIRATTTAASAPEYEVRHTLRVNGRPAPGGRPRWQVRLALTWHPDSVEHAWLSVECDPPRPGVASGAWVLPLSALRDALDAPASAGVVHLAPEGVDRTWLEVSATVGASSRPWAVSVPQRWLRHFLDEVGLPDARPLERATVA